MNFLSPEFAFAALVFFPVYWWLKPWRRAQMWALTAAGYALYATWSPLSALLLLIYSVNIWMAGLWIADAPQNRRRFFLVLGLVLALPLLLLTKYYEFLRQALAQLLPALGWHSLLPVIDFVAPAGVSFFTFQAVTYLVWRYQQPRARCNLRRTLLFLSFWPTLFSGPILRAEHFFKQLDAGRFGTPLQPVRALYYLLLGMAQKLVFANWLQNQWVDQVFQYPEQQNLLSVLLAAWGYALQIFCDFAGYTLIVTGLALLLGFILPVNFRQPYLARNLKDFWQRWHISLSSFIRDYVYIPLGGNRAGFGRAQANILLAMLLSGLWHGANATFLIWGLLHGLGVVLVNLYQRLRGPRLPTALAVALTLAYVSLAWLFFRADNLDTVWLLLNRSQTLPETPPQDMLYLLLFSLGFFVLSLRADWLEQRSVQLFSGRSPWMTVPLATGLSGCLSFLIILLGPNGVPGFIYYRF